MVAKGIQTRALATASPAFYRWANALQNMLETTVVVELYLAESIKLQIVDKSVKRRHL